MRHSSAALLGLVLLASLHLSAAQTTLTLLPEQLRGTLSFGHVGDFSPSPIHINAGTPENQGNVNFTITSSVWPITPGLTLRVILEASYDGGVTWGFLTGNSPIDPNDAFQSANPTKDGSGLVKFGTRWDGRALDLRGTLTPNVPFLWGVDVTF